MPTAELRSRLQKLPKVDLHRHLEGSLRLATLLDIALAHNVELPPGDLQQYVQMGKNERVDFQQFLSKFKLLRRFYRSPEAVDRLAYETVADAAHDNIRYLELRFSPQALCAVQNFSLADATDWVIAAVRRAEQDFSITVRLILSIVRHDPLPLAEQVIAIAADRVDQGVVAVDLTGDEVNYPCEPFVSLFREAQRVGLHVTAHAGEWTRASNVLQAIELLQAERIGHGIRIMEDPQVVQLARDRQIYLEVCLTSNLQTGAVPFFGYHPIREMLHSGLLVTINTDDPSISDTTLTDEYLLAMRYGGLSEVEIHQCLRNGIRASFLPAPEKLSLMAQFNMALGSIVENG